MLNSEAAAAPGVQTQGLEKRFGRQVALAGVDLRVPQGSTYLLAGTNGAGKSTLLRTLLNIEAPDQGAAIVLGLDTRANGPRVRARTGYVPETGEGVYRWIRVGSFLKHHARFYSSWDHDYARQLIDALDVRTESRFGALSKGQSRRVQIVAALAHRPLVLLLDELTDGLDPLAREEVLGLLATHLADTGCTTILSTHLVAEIETLVDHIGVLASGKLVVQSSTERLLQRLLRYHLDAPAGWSLPLSPGVAIVRQEAGLGSGVKLVAMGEEADVRAAIAASGPQLREVTRLSLAEAVPMLLKSEKPHAFT
jgi:ABC-2 type transport system ATP-binding protein